MSFEDKSLHCSDCRQTFTFTAGEQQFFANKGFTNEPRRCPACRRAKRQQQDSGTGSRGGSYYGNSSRY